MQLRFTIISVIAIQLLQCLNASAVPRRLSSRHEQSLSSSLSAREHNSSIIARERDLPTAPALIARDWRLSRNIFQTVQDYAPGWQAHFNLLDMVVPNYHVAAMKLEEFYAEILGTVGDVWASEPARYVRECSLGEISLSLRSNQPIQWEWIQGFATDMVRFVLILPVWRYICRVFNGYCNGLTAEAQIHKVREQGDAVIASYKVTFISVAGAIVVAQLRIPLAGAAAAA
ncbi:MAG: hypothetical protein LQ346_005037 [Caloplaca aetnensis]|nr:MAG: hypothetical protein LQ346_005037 [Caloplaca aetnensis]